MRHDLEKITGLTEEEAMKFAKANEEKNLPASGSVYYWHRHHQLFIKYRDFMYFFDTDGTLYKKVWVADSYTSMVIMAESVFIGRL